MDLKLLELEERKKMQSAILYKIYQILYELTKYSWARNLVTLKIADAIKPSVPNSALGQSGLIMHMKFRLLHAYDVYLFDENACHSVL